MVRMVKADLVLISLSGNQSIAVGAGRDRPCKTTILLYKQSVDDISRTVSGLLGITMAIFAP